MNFDIHSMKQLETLYPVGYSGTGTLPPTYAPFSTRRRPSTRSGNRFGQLSMNSFFTRHTPHPQRVRHMKGLLDVPICIVVDNVDPPSRPQTKSSRLWTGSLSNVDRFKGLKQFYKDKVLPKHGPLAQMESWREELHNFTNQLGFSPRYVLPGRLQEGLPEARSRTGANMYSSETGRLIPPPSRAMSRQGPRLSLKERLFNQMSEQSYQTEMENQVLTMLCQILNTDDVNTVQGWLMCAGDKERTLVSELIKAAIGSQLEEATRPPEIADHRSKPEISLPPIMETGNIENGQVESKRTTHKVDRLILETPRPITGMPKGLEENSRSNRKKQEIIESTTPAVYESQDKTALDTIKAPVTETFRRLKQVPVEKLTNPDIKSNGRQHEHPSASRDNQSQPKMKYSKMSHGRNVESHNQPAFKINEASREWNQEMSVDKHTI